MKMVKRIAAIVLIILLLGFMAWGTMKVAELFSASIVNVGP